ncbi:DUF3347 domain-containing protein [Bernardetia sp. ABR2-2B]|jgi:hypothetical protein|uniref:DUF3347 domain-containing protein n=1 Tax=unclassified Bernardetia TaxID=2647129 RepID=UPI0030CD1251
MKKLIYVFASATLLLYSCNNASTENKEANAENMTEENMADMNHDEMNHDNMNHDNSSMENNEIAKNQTISTVLDAYFNLKNALVEDNDEKAAEASVNLTAAFKGLDKSSLAADQTTKFDEIIESATEHAEHISENKGNIVHQREHLALLSKDVKDLVGIMGTDRTLYADFCPMYDNNKGAMWLSASKEIKNPYFGSKMLSCGKVQEEITVK